MPMPPTVVGIDLGTTFSLAAYMEGGRPVVVRDENGVALVPSVLSFHDDGTVLVGSEARKRCLSDPDHTVYSVKRLMGRTLERCRSALRDAQLTAKDVGEVVLVGGSTRIPYVRRRVEAFFGRKPHTELNADEVVAMGAAIQADILTSNRKNVLLLDVV